MSYRIAGIDVHKKMLAVVVTDVEVQGEYEFERIRYGSNPEQLRLLVYSGRGAEGQLLSHKNQHAGPSIDPIPAKN